MVYFLSFQGGEAWWDVGCSLASGTGKVHQVPGTLGGLYVADLKLERKDFLLSEKQATKNRIDARKWREAKEEELEEEEEEEGEEEE